MLVRFSTLALLVIVLSSCGSSAVPATHATLSCGAKYMGHGVDTLNFSLTCTMLAPVHATAVTLTGTSPTSTFTYTWCKNQAVASQGATTCQDQFVVIVPQSMKQLTITATFSPSQEHVTTTIPVAIPQG